MVGEAGLQTVDTPQVPVGCFVTVGTQFNQILDKVLEMGQEGGYGLGPTVVELETKDLVLNGRAHGIGNDSLSELGDELRVEHLGISRGAWQLFHCTCEQEPQQRVQAGYWSGRQR